ncbi:MAG: CDP-diacylglycerol--serine O-phosphatidyltransferase [Candidatus Zixiibacteriota bacterium]
MKAQRIKGLVPNIFTMGNVVCGFLAILSSFEGEIITACWLIILAGFLDVMDGKIARFSGTTSQFGVELDSLSDFLSFGVAPSVIVYVVKLQYMGKWGWLISVVYIMAASYRLARFNVMAEEGEKKDFAGLPTPMAAGVPVTFIIFINHFWNGQMYTEYLVTIMILCSALMVSQIEYDAFPDGISTRKNKIKFMFIIIAAIGALIKPELLLFPIFALYIIIGLGREIYRFFYLGVGLVRKHQLKNRNDMEKLDGE